MLGTWPLIEQWSKLYYIGGEGDAEIFSHKIHHNCYNEACTFWPPSWRENDAPKCILTLPQTRIHSYAMFIPEYMTVCTETQNVNCPVTTTTETPCAPWQGCPNG